MTLLSPMRAEAFPAYIESSVAGYADANIASGRWPRKDASARARVEYDALLPQGLATADNHLFEIRAAKDGAVVGVIWFAVMQRHGIRDAYIYDVEIKKQFRRQGHAKRAFQLLEARVAALGITSIGLHVFGHNAGAQALYHQLGYAVTGINMRKQLGASGA